MSQFRRLRNWGLTPAKLQMRLELLVLGIRTSGLEFQNEARERLLARCAALPPPAGPAIAFAPPDEFAHVPRRRVGPREAAVTDFRDALDDRLMELYIEHCMPPPPWIRWDPSHVLGLEWKLAVLESRPSRYSPVDLSRLRCSLEWDTLTGGEPEYPVDNRRTLPYIHHLLESPPPAGASDFSDPLPEWDSRAWRVFCQCPSDLTMELAQATLHDEVFPWSLPPWTVEWREWRDVCLASHPNDWGWLAGWRAKAAATPPTADEKAKLMRRGHAAYERGDYWESHRAFEAARVGVNAPEPWQLEQQAASCRRDADRDRAKFAVLNALRGRAESAAAQIRRREAQLARVRNELIE